MMSGGLKKHRRFQSALLKIAGRGTGGPNAYRTVLWDELFNCDCQLRQIQPNLAIVQ